jgi:hypothetical protein
MYIAQRDNREFTAVSQFIVPPCGAPGAPPRRVPEPIYRFIGATITWC